jgi:ABC-type proline/glycine betaine transport system ATPase subunit
LPFPVLLNGSETRTIKARDARGITTAETRDMRRTVGYTWSDIRKFTNCKIVKNSTNFGKITGIQEKLYKTRK